MSTRTVHCPKCGSTDIRERNEAFADLPVISWDFDEGGTPKWSTIENGHQYTCHACDWEGELEDLNVFGREDFRVLPPEADDEEDDD